MKLKKIVKYALIGATRIGGQHLEVLREMQRGGDIKLVAVADPALERLSNLKAEVNAHGTRTYTDFTEMLRDEPDLDVVVISAPIPFHLKMTLACLERNVFVYLEKPPVPLIQQLKTMIAADKHQRVGVGFQMINANRVQEVKRAIVRGDLGRLKSVRIGACWPRLDHYYGRNSSAGKLTVQGEPVFDGPVTNALAHLIHNAMFFAGGSKEEFDTPTEIQAEMYRARPIESYDIACLRGTLRSGVTFTAALTHATEELLPYRMEILGTDGWVRISNDGADIESSFRRAFRAQETFEKQLAMSHRQFLDFVRGASARPATSLFDTLGYVLATNGMMLSSANIHTIDGTYLRQYISSAEKGYDVAGLREAVNDSVRTGLLFSELGLPWAVKTAATSVENLDCLILPGAVPCAGPQYV